MLWESFLCKIVKMLFPKIKHVFRIHTYIDCSHITIFKKNIYHFMVWFTDLLVNRYLPINEYNLKEMETRTHLSPKKIKIIHDMVRVDESARTICEFKNGHIAMIANFVEFKGHDVLLDAMKILKDRDVYKRQELYDAIKYHNFFTFARWVYDLPGEFCYFLRVVLRTKQILKKFSKRRRLAGSRGCLRIDSSGKGKYHPIPQQKGGEK